MKKRIIIEGVMETTKNLEKVEAEVVKIAFGRALEDLGWKIGELSAKKVPVDEGMLKNSFTVQKIKDKWVCGYNTEYAAYQHEGVWPDGSHQKLNFPGGGELYFLSNTVKKYKDQLLEFLQERFVFYFNKIKL